MRLPGCTFDSAWCLVCEVCRLTVHCVDCRCSLSFVFLGCARRLELSPCNTLVKDTTILHIATPQAGSSKSTYTCTRSTGGWPPSTCTRRSRASQPAEVVDAPVSTKPRNCDHLHNSLIHSVSFSRLICNLQRGGSNDSILVQDVLVPCALENLGCTGNETRLVDCPVATPPPDGENFAGACNPYIRSYARVTCGSSRDVGAPMSVA